MKTLFHEKGGLIGKYIINQIAMSLFGFMMSATAVAMGHDWLLPFGLFGLLFYYFILFTFVYEDGLKDALRVDGGRMKRDRLLSLKYCSLAAIPAFAIALLNFLLRAFGSGRAVAAIYSVLDTLTRFFTYGMYNALDNYLFTSSYETAQAEVTRAYFSASGLSFVCYTVLTLLVCVIAYNMGLAQTRLNKNDKKNV